MRKKNKISIKFITVFLLSFVFLFNSIKPITYSANAEGVFCPNVYGGGLTPGSITGRVLEGAELLPDSRSRTYTFQELFGTSLNLSRFNGETEGNWFFAYKDAGLAESVSDERAKERITARGEDYSACITAPMSNVSTDLVIGLTSGVNSFVSLLITSLFDPGFPQASQTAVSTEEQAQNALVEIVGGKNNEGGIIKELANSIYYPLLGITLAIAAMYLIYQGLIKRQFRMTFQSIGWILGAILIGVLIAEKPTLVAKAPQTATSTFVGCILDGLTGGNCLTGQGTGEPSAFISDICISQGSGGAKASASFKTNSLSCGIWKAFSLNSWTNSQFGYNFDELYTQGAPDGNTSYDLSTSGVDPGAFCIRTGSSNSINEIRKSRNPEFNMGQNICNIAGAQLAVQSGMIQGDQAMNIRKNLAIVAAHDPVMFSKWGLSRGTFTYSLEAAIGTFFALFAILSIAVRGHMYSFLATITIAFGPLFALFAIHPGKGRKLFLGWLENIIGYIL